MINTMVSGVTDYLSILLAPQKCVVCGDLSKRSIPLCVQCESKYLSLTSFHEGRCSRCGRLLISAKTLCMDCRTVEPLQMIDRVYPLFSYDRTAQELLASWKIGCCFGLTALFARCLMPVLSHFPGIPVVPVPPRPGKIRQKGWDQIDVLARKLETGYGIPVLRCLKRTSIVQQKKLGREERGKNLQGNITLKKNITLPETVIVLDDIMTTGATLEACACALKETSETRIYGVTLFYD